MLPYEAIKQIRELQTSKGFEPCFRCGAATCDKDCCWKPVCLVNQVYSTIKWKVVDDGHTI